jgi:hypothetical protein
VPDPVEEIAVQGRTRERALRRARELLIALIRFPIRLLTLPLRQVREEVAALRAAAVDSLAYVGVELRRLGDLVERGGAPGVGAAANGNIGAAGFSELAGVEAPGPVLVIGPRGAEVAPSLASLGYEIELAPAGVKDDGADPGRRFAAALYLGDGPGIDSAELERIEARLVAGGPVVIALRSAANGVAPVGRSGTAEA